MKLYFSPASPFSRKARVIARELQLAMEEVEISARGNQDFRRINPLGKIPALVLDDGSALFDSPVICEYLDHRGGGKFFPGTGVFGDGKGRWKALGLQALGDGLMEAALGLVYEDRFRTPEQRSESIIANTMSMIVSALDALEHVALSETPTIGEVTIGCALGYLDFRLTNMDWRTTRPKLAAWCETFSRYPSMQATRPR